MSDTNSNPPTGKSFWRRRVAGIPVIYLAAGIVAILAIVAFRMRNTNADTTMAEDVPMEADQNSEADQFDTAYDASYAQFSTKGSITAVPAESANQDSVVETNETWLSKAVAWNIQKGVSAGTAQNALQAYLSGADLTATQGVIRDNTVKEFGLPPDPPSMTNPTPATPSASDIPRRQGPLARTHIVKNASENTYAKLAALYYPTADSTSIALIRSKNVGRLASDGPFAVGTGVRIPQYVVPKYFMSTKKVDTAREIAAKNGISDDAIRALNPGAKFPVKSGTRVRVR